MANGESSRVLFSLSFAAVLLFFPFTAAAPVENIKGEAFTDPAFIQQMPPGWKDQTVKYDPEAEKADVVVTLDQHLYPAISEIVREYAVSNGLNIYVSEGTCGITAGKLARKAVDIGGYCCPPGLTDRLPDLRFHTIGVAPLAIFVNPENPIDNITLNQAREIFQGKIRSWSEIRDSKGRPGAGLKIQTVGRLHCKIRPGHWRSLLDNEDLFSPRLQEVGTIPDMISLVASAPGAIGYEVMMMADRYRNEGRVKALKIDGHAPDKASLLSGEYPFYRTLNVTTWEGNNVNNPNAKKLVAYLLSRLARLEKEFGIIPASSLRDAGWKFRDNELIGEGE